MIRTIPILIKTLVKLFLFLEDKFDLTGDFYHFQAYICQIRTEFSMKSVIGVQQLQ